MSGSVEEHSRDQGEERESDSEGTPQLSRYQILQKLAVGGMAEIFVAQKHGSPDVCVVKQLHAHLTEDTVVGARFLREAQVASLLDHPHIARLTDAGREGRFYLAMEFIAGQDVETMMFRLMEQRKMLPPELSVTVTLDVLEGLQYAHDLTGENKKPLEIVHRDLSPRNVMVTYQGRVKIIDFGLARTNLGDFRTAPGMVLGTMRYMSPEQAVAEPVDRRSDIYSWSVVLYEMLSGRPLVMGANAQEVLHAVVTQVPPPLSTLNPALPKALDAVLERGLAKDRRDRWENAGELRHALLEAAGSLAALDDERHNLIGRFVRELFPTEHAETKAMLESLERGEGNFEPTRLGPAKHEVTRATYLNRVSAMKSAAIAAVDKEPPPEMTRLAPDPAMMNAVNDALANLGPPAVLARGQYPAPSELKDQRRLLYFLVGMVGLAMFTVACAMTWLVVHQQPDVMITAPPPINAVQVEQKPRSEQKVIPVQQAVEKHTPIVEEKRSVPRGAEQQPVKREQRAGEKTKEPSPASKSALPEVQRKKILYDDVAIALDKAQKAVDAVGDEPTEVDVDALRRATDLIFEHARSLGAPRNEAVMGCLRAIDFGPFKARLDRAKRCFAFLEEAGK